MKVAYIQTSPKFLKVSENLSCAEKRIQKCTADLIVLPELFNTGYNFRSKKEIQKVAETISSSQTVKKIQKLSREKKCAIVAGIAEKSGEKFYNSAVFVTPHEVKVYRKIHLFAKEKIFFSAGNLGFNVFKWKNAKIGVMICFDWFFPESCRTLALKGAEIIAHPANLVLPYCPEAMKTRALENHVFTVTANRVGKENNLTFIGQSEIVNPFGKILLRASTNSEEIGEMKIDLNSARNKKLNPLNHVLKDRREKFYC